MTATPASPRPSLPPLARRVPGLGAAPWLLRDAPGFFLAEAIRVGTPARIAMGPVGTVTLVAEPDDVRHVLVERARDYPRGTAIELVRPMLGDGLPLADGEAWIRHRRTMQPAFGRARTPDHIIIASRSERGDAAASEYEDVARNG